MPITTTRVAGDIFEVPIDLIAVWLHHGFARIHWDTFLKNHFVTVFPNDRSLEAGDPGDEPWLSKDALLSVNGRDRSPLRWVYALNTQQNGLGYKTLSEVAHAVWRVLDTAHLLDLRSVGLMYVRYAPEGSRPTKMLQDLAAATMVTAIHAWSEKHPDCDSEVKLVDISGGFDQLGVIVPDA